MELMMHEWSLGRNEENRIPCSSSCAGIPFHWKRFGVFDEKEMFNQRAD
jgi:hypothetical protein